MNATEFAEAKLLWKSFYAGNCFVQVREAAQHILDNKLEKEAPLFHQLIVAIYTLYAKPFTRSDGVGRLEETFVPKEHLQQHKLMIEHRHQIYAHRDADGFQIVDYGSVNQVRSVRTHEAMWLQATDFHARYTAMPSIIKLCVALEQKTDYNVQTLWHKYNGTIPKKIGECLLNVLDETRDMWLPQQPMILPQPKS